MAKNKLKQAVDKNLSKQESDSTAARYNKLSTLLSNLGGEDEMFSVDEFGEPLRDPFLSSDEDKALRTQFKKKSPRA